MEQELWNWTESAVEMIPFALLAGFYKEKEINAKSVLNVMASGIRCGDEITVHCDGPDEKEAIEAVCNLIETGLKE